LEIPQKADEKMHESNDGKEAKKLCQQWRKSAEISRLLQLRDH
jgi:hypothetical protein